MGVDVGESQNVKISESLGKYTSIFQAEVHAIEICVRKIMSSNPENRSINILSDSKAALLSAYFNPSTEVKSKLVWDCIKLIKELSTGNVVMVTLIWVP